MRAAGFDDSFAKARRYFSATVGNSAPSELQDAYIEQGRVALDYLLKHSDLEVMAVHYPDYNPEIDGGMFGRAHAPLEFDARKLGPAFKDIRGFNPRMLMPRDRHSRLYFCLRYYRYISRHWTVDLCQFALQFPRITRVRARARHGVLGECARGTRP